MTLFRAEQHAFKFLSNFYRFLWKFFIKWDSEFKNVYAVKPFVPNLIPFISSISFTFLFTLTCGSVPVVYSFWHSRPGFNLVYSFILFLQFAVQITEIAIIYILLKYLDEIVLFFNGILQMSENLRNGNILMNIFTNYRFVIQIVL